MMATSLILTLRSEEKNLLDQSIVAMTGKLDILIEKFYTKFLNSDKQIAKLFQHTDMIKQQNMFNVAFGLIVTNIDNPDLLQLHIDKIIEKHRLYGVNSEHVSYFTNSLTDAVREVFGNDDEVIKAWLKLINDVMYYFKTTI